MVTIRFPVLFVLCIVFMWIPGGVSTSSLKMFFNLRFSSLRPTSSAEMLRTGMPLISSTRSPVCMEGSRSELRTAESNLRENYSQEG